MCFLFSFHFIAFFLPFSGQKYWLSFKRKILEIPKIPFQKSLHKNKTQLWLTVITTTTITTYLLPVKNIFSFTTQTTKKFCKTKQEKKTEIEAKRNKSEITLKCSEDCWIFTSLQLKALFFCIFDSLALTHIQLQRKSKQWRRKFKSTLKSY